MKEIKKEKQTKLGGLKESIKPYNNKNNLSFLEKKEDYKLRAILILFNLQGSSMTLQEIRKFLLKHHECILTYNLRHWLQVLYEKGLIHKIESIGGRYNGCRYRISDNGIYYIEKYRNYFIQRLNLTDEDR